MNNFMTGYIRTPEMTEKLLDALTLALWKNPEQRLGQLLMNLNRDDKRDLWNIWDEKWIELLEQREKK